MIKKILINVLVIVCIFFTMFPINFIFTPSYLSTRVIIALFGCVFLLIEIRKHGLYLPKNVLYTYGFSAIFVFWSFLSTVFFNSVFDFTFVKHLYTITVMILSTFGCIFLLNLNYNKVDFKLISNYYLATILLQSLIAILMFSNTTVANFLNSIQILPERTENIISYQLDAQNRFFGFGLIFYTASFFYGAALILIADKLKNINNTRNIYLWYVCYIFFAIVGMAMSRSTIIGVGISIFMLVLGLKIRTDLPKTIFNLIVKCFAIFIFLIICISLFSETVNKYKALLENAFDFVINYFEEGHLSSESATDTFSMLVLPQLERTYILGTGYYEHYASVFDFVYSDIGYLRLLYYGGVIAIVLFLLFEIKVLKYAFYDKGYSNIFYSFTALLLITNVKGLTTLAVIAFLFYYIPYKKKELDT